MTNEQIAELPRQCLLAVGGASASETKRHAIAAVVTALPRLIIERQQLLHALRTVMPLVKTDRSWEKPMYDAAIDAIAFAQEPVP